MLSTCSRRTLSVYCLWAVGTLSLFGQKPAMRAHTSPSISSLSIIQRRVNGVAVNNTTVACVTPLMVGDAKQNTTPV
jgi:hypothetical protein